MSINQSSFVQHDLVFPLYRTKYSAQPPFKLGASIAHCEPIAELNFTTRVTQERLYNNVVEVETVAGGIQLALHYGIGANALWVQALSWRGRP